MLIAELAFDELTSSQQAELLEILKQHPRFAEDFKIPEKAGDAEHWIFERSAYWPDIARRSPYDRPNWHWQLGTAMTIGDVANVPDHPEPCPSDATLDTKDLHIAQALELCRRVLRDKSRPAEDRAIAICWIGHLVGDAHQPCHSGSLYCAAFPAGDRGANSIPTRQSKNLHAVWDGLLGPKYDAGDIKRRAREIKADGETWNAAIKAAKVTRDLNPLVWLEESSLQGRAYVYAMEVLDPIRALKAGETLKEIDLSQTYLKQAGAVAQRRAAFAAQRLAAILKEDLTANPSP